MDIKSLLVKYFNGECTSEEAEYLLKSLNSGDAADYKDVVFELWNDLQSNSEIDQRLSEKIFKRIKNNNNSRKPDSEQINKSIFRRYIYSIAASVTGIIIISGFAFYMLTHSYDKVYQTSFGEKLKVLLPDSSEVTLNANSILKLNEKDFNNNREVWISGEIFFDINKKVVGEKKIKFIVRTNDLTIEILGTKFNVNARRKSTQVVLESGKIQLSLNNQNKNRLLMKPGDYVSYSENRLERKVVDPSDYTAWKSNILSFDESTIEQIAQTVEDHFGYKVVWENENLKNKLYKGTFPADNVDVLLQSLSRSFNLQIIMAGNTIYMKNSLPVDNK